MNFTITPREGGKAELLLDGELMDVLTPAEAKRVTEAWATVQPYVGKRLSDVAQYLREIAKDIS